MNDEQLLEKYKNYIKKRNMIILFSLLLIILIVVTIFMISPKKNIVIPPNNNIPIEDKRDADVNPPVLELTTNSTKIIAGEEFDYKSVIKRAYDDIDGDITDKVSFSKIDLTKEGTFEIVYYVFDSSNNIAQQILTLIIEAKPNEVEPEPITPEPPIQNNKPSSNKNTNSNNNNNTNREKPVLEPITKYFLFTDGYTMSNMVEACAKELKESNRTGRCIPITDDNGIYLGMKLEIN